MLKKFILLNLFLIFFVFISCGKNVIYRSDRNFDFSRNFRNKYYLKISHDEKNIYNVKFMSYQLRSGVKGGSCLALALHTHSQPLSAFFLLYRSKGNQGES